MFDSMQNAEIISALTKEFNEVRKGGKNHLDSFEWIPKNQDYSFRSASLNLVHSLYPFLLLIIQLEFAEKVK